MGARLALSLVSLGIAVALDAVGVGYRFAQPRGLWGTVGFAFLATAVYGLVLPRVRNQASASPRSTSRPTSRS